MASDPQETPWAREKRVNGLAAALTSVSQDDLVDTLRAALTKAGHDPRVIGFRLGLKTA